MGVEVAVAVAAGIGAITGIGSGVMGLNQAAEAEEANSKAAQASKELMEEAARKAEVEFMQTLNVPLDAYNQQYENQLQSQQQSLQALQEGDSRNLAAGVGAVGAAATAAQENTRIAQGKELFSLRKMQAEEQQSINEDLKDMNVGAAADQQQMARDAQEQSNAAKRSAVAGFGQAASSAAALVPLYAKSANDKIAGKIAGQLSTDAKTGLGGRMVANKAYGDGTYYNKVSKPLMDDPNNVGGPKIANPDYNKDEAALYAPTIMSNAINNQAVIDKLSSTYDRKELKKFYADNNYDSKFYDQFYNN